MTRWALSVDRDEFAQALDAALFGVGRKTSFSLRLEFAADGLSVSGPGAMTTIPASGSWPAAVLVPSAAAKHLATRLPDISPFTLKIEDGRLKIGGFSLEVKVMDVAPKRIELVVGANSHDVLIAIARHGEAKTIASVGARTVEIAKEDLNRAAGNAFSKLEEFGVTREEVDELVRASLMRQARRIV